MKNSFLFFPSLFSVIRSVFVVLLLAVTASVWAASPEEPPLLRVVARVNEMVITNFDVLERQRMIAMVRRDPSLIQPNPELLQIFFGQLVNDALVLQEAKHAKSLLSGSELAKHTDRFLRDISKEYDTTPDKLLEKFRISRGAVERMLQRDFFLEQWMADKAPVGEVLESSMTAALAARHQAVIASVEWMEFEMPLGGSASEHAWARTRLESMRNRWRACQTVRHAGNKGEFRRHRQTLEQLPKDLRRLLIALSPGKPSHRMAGSTSDSERVVMVCRVHYVAEQEKNLKDTVRDHHQTEAVERWIETLRRRATIVMESQ